MTALMVTAALLLAGCDTTDPQHVNTAADPDAVRFAVFEPLSGKYRAEGEMEKQGIELAHELYPEVGGERIELVIIDNGSEIESAARAAESLVERGVTVVLGSYGSTLSLAGSNLFEKAEIPALAITNTNPLVTNSNDYYFRVCFVESFQGVAVAKYAVEELAVSKAAVMRETDHDFSAAVCQAFSDKFIALTGNPDAVVYTAEYHADTADYRSELNAIREAGAEVVFLPLDAARARTVLSQAREVGVEAVFLGTNNWENDEFLQITDPAILSKAAFASYFGQDTELTDLSHEFVTAWHEKYGADSTPEPAAALGFDAYMLARSAVSDAGIKADGKAIRDMLAKTRSFPGASGNITFDESGDPIKSVSILTVRNGVFETVYTAEPVWGPAPEKD